MTKNTTFFAPYVDTQTGNKGCLAFNHPTFYTVMFTQGNDDTSFIVNASGPKAAISAVQNTLETRGATPSGEAKVNACDFSSSMIPYLVSGLYEGFVADNEGTPKFIPLQSKDITTQAMRTEANAVCSVLEMLARKMARGFDDTPIKLAGKVFEDKFVAALVRRADPTRSVKACTLMTAQVSTFAPN